jgi:hypothetical protein
METVGGKAGIYAEKALFISENHLIAEDEALDTCYRKVTMILQLW